MSCFQLEQRRVAGEARATSEAIRPCRFVSSELRVKLGLYLLAYSGHWTMNPIDLLEIWRRSDFYILRSYNLLGSRELEVFVRVLSFEAVTCDATCRCCIEEEETAEYLLCQCEALCRPRHIILGRETECKLLCMVAIVEAVDSYQEDRLGQGALTTIGLNTTPFLSQSKWDNEYKRPKQSGCLIRRITV